jgi:3-hydroxyacyl-CoA dehydrogenase/enoyl-CoA hydratase/3-hydroxybutyryl-CoA epimerase
VTNEDHVDAGVIFGTGLAPFRGGPLHYRRMQEQAARSAAAA